MKSNSSTTQQKVPVNKPDSAPSMVYAGFWSRAAAVIIDGLIVGFINGVLSALLSGITTDTLANLVSVTITVLYWVVYQARAGQTLGKRALGIKVVDEQGETPTMLVFFLREVIGKFISGVILFIGYFMAAFDSRKQALHDKIAGTYVIKV